MLNEDYKDIIRAFHDEGVDFLLIGAYAMAVHGYVRATMDMDLWVLPEPGNAQSVYRALLRFGAPGNEISPADFQESDVVLQIGVAPRRIDILTSVSGLSFADARQNAVVVHVEDLTFLALGLGDLIRTKEASGRLQDLADVEALQSIQASGSAAG